MVKSFWTAQEVYSWAVYGDETIIGSRQVPPRKARTFPEVRAKLRDGIARHRISGSALIGNRRQSLDPQQFRDFPGMAVDEFGDIVPLVPHKDRVLPIEGKKVLLSEREIKSFFPIGADKAEQWMHNFMERNPRSKKSTAVAECCQALGLTVRAAKEAWSKVGPGLGRGPGRRIKSPALSTYRR